MQFGADPVAQFDEVTLWQERLIDALQTGVPDAMIVRLAAGLGAPVPEAERFVERIRPALTSHAESGPDVVMEVPDDLDHREEHALSEALRSAGVNILRTRRWSEDGDRVPAIIIAHRLLDPRRAARLAAADVTHLPVELSGDRVSVGPLVVPGRTGCVACLHAHRREADPQWPLLAAQLLGRAPTPTDPALLLEAALLAGRLLRTPPSAASMSVAVSSSNARRTWRAHRPHAHCLCRSPEGSASVDAPEDRSSEPTTARAYARPA